MHLARIKEGILNNRRCRFGRIGFSRSIRNPGNDEKRLRTL